VRGDFMGGHAFSVSESAMGRDSGRGAKGSFRCVSAVYLLLGETIQAKLPTAKRQYH
jgi:hypothetical protein